MDQSPELIISNKSEIDVKVLGRRSLWADELEMISIRTDIIDWLSVGTFLLNVHYKIVPMVEPARTTGPAPLLNVLIADSRNARGKAAGQVRADQGRHELPTALPYIAP